MIGTGVPTADRKAIVDWTRSARRRTVRAIPDVEAGPARGYVIYLAQFAQECPPWWSPDRDRYLRKFWPSEPFLAGAIYSIAARNAAYQFELVGPSRQVKRAQRMLAESDLGRGWHSLMMKATLDLLTQDNGGFIEVIRPARVIVRSFKGGLARWNGVPLEGVKTGVIDLGTYSPEFVALAETAGLDLVVPTWGAVLPTGDVADLLGEDYEVKDSPYDLALGLAHLDAGRCIRTGNPEAPVVYTDLDGKPHRLKWWQVITLEEMPSTTEEMFDIQYCMVSRVFRLAQTLRDMQVLMQEKASGRFAGRVYLTNVSADAIQDAVEMAKEGADARGLMRYMPPILADTVDPHAEPKVATIDLANLPEGFDFGLYLQWYISGMALTGGTDYGFLAPLPGKGLGTASQSEVQERQARGKSSRLFQGMVTQRLNFGGVLPRSVTFQYTETDHAEQAAVDTGKKTRAETRKIMIETGEITAAVARQMAVDEGDYPASYLAMMQEADVTPVETASDATPVEAEQDQERVVGEFTAKQPAPAAQPGPEQGGGSPAAGEKGGPGSGHYRHRGRFGQIGGSMAGSTARMLDFYTPKGVTDLSEVSQENRARLKDQVARGLCERLGLDPDDPEAYGDMSATVHQWAISSTDDDLRSLSLQRAAAQELSLPGSEYVAQRIAEVEDDRETRIEDLIDWQHGQGSRIHNREEAIEYLSRYPGLFPLEHASGVTDRQFVRAMYENTQAQLREWGFGPDDTIRVYRGTAIDAEQALDVRHGHKTVAGNPMESWSIREDVAATFGIGREEEDDWGWQRGIVLSVDVAAKDVLSLPQTGMGCLPEGEVIIMGSKARPIHSVKYATDYYPERGMTRDEWAAWEAEHGKG
jgi:hypothetical protein